MRPLRAFLLGALALGLLGYASAAAVAVTAQAAGSTIHLALGPLDLLSVARDGNAVVTTFGPGLAAVALLGGVVNLAAAVLVARRARGVTDRVD